MSYVATAATKVYGDANPSFTGTITGFVSGDDQANATAGTLTFTTSANNTSSIGSYDITGSGLTAQNYVFEQAASNATALTITTRPVTITAEAKTKTYGDADPALTFQITSGNLVNGDNFTGNLTRAAGEDAGTYSINQNSVALSTNYDLSYQSATLTINKAILMVTANSAERCYGDNNPAFGVSYSGFKYNDNENSLRSKPTVGTTANAGSVAGDYALIPDGDISDNYIFDYHSGTLSINPLPVNTISSDKGNSISRGETAVLTVNSDNGTTYRWSSAAGIISGENSAMLTVRPMQTTTYTVTVTNANGCESSSSFTLEVRGDYQAVDAENFITPNGDGVNDTWVVKNIDAYPDHTLTIVDRAGRQVYQTRNYKNDWNGTLEGSPLAPGTYYYILRFDEPGAQYFRGFITIVRQ
ncbi:gliding motility-associated C-terminal domain-containing protein [Pseudoxanthomonas sp. SGD-10]|nr:gliding motility-associated C-terminal domain-containing protein [Pseudoxanthomonas sp. SGD-10]